MDAPTHLDFAGLEALAGDRAAWKKQIEITFGRKRNEKKKKRRNGGCTGPSGPGGRTLGRRAGKGADSVWIGPSPQLKRREAPSTLRTASTVAKFSTLSSLIAKPAKTAQVQLSHYWGQNRTGKNGDRINSKTTKPGDNKKSCEKPERSKRTSKPKAATRTDTQRAAWAHAHFIIHHGTGDDAQRFMSHPKNITDTPADALHEVHKMAAMRIPTWKEAKAAVFSSSSSEESMEAAQENGLQSGGQQEWDIKAGGTDITSVGEPKNLASKTTDNKTAANINR